MTDDTTTQLKPELNRKALRDIIPVLRRLDAEGCFNMRKWAIGPVNPNAADYTECGTQFCLAGAKAVADGWRPQYEMHDIYADSGTGSARNVPVATGKFVRPENRHDSYYLSPNARFAKDIAKEAFGLDDDHMHFLFYGDHITRVEDLVGRIEWVIGGNRPLHYPARCIAAEVRHADEDAEKVAEQRNWRDRLVAEALAAESASG